MAHSETNESKLKTSSQGSKTGHFLRWFILGIIFILVVVLFLIQTVRTLPRVAIAEISKLANAKISVGSLDIRFDGSVLIRNLVVKPTEAQDYDNTILRAGTVYARFSVPSLLLLRPRLNEIRVNDFIFDAKFDLDTGRWNIVTLKQNVPKGGSGKMPLIHLEKGRLRYCKVKNGQVEVAAAIPIDAKFGSDEEKQDGYSFNITTATIAGGFGKSNLRGLWRPGNITVAGGISSTDIPSFERTLVIDILAAELTYDKEGSYSLKLSIEDLHSTRTPEAETYEWVRPAFLDKSTPFTALQKFFSRYRPAGTVDIRLDAWGNFKRLNESILKGIAHCKDVSICDRKFPYLIEHIAGNIDLAESKVDLRDLSGKHGDVDVTIGGWAGGFGPDWQYYIKVTSGNMALDRDLYDAFSAKWKELWDTFSPHGLAAIDCTFSRSSQTDKKKTLVVNLLGVDAQYRRFPYPLRNLTGKLFFDRDSVIVSDVLSQVEGRRITLNGRVAGRGTDRPIYYLSAKANDIPLDSTLEAALPEKQRSLYNRLNMTGLADASIMIFTPSEGQGSASFLADVSVKDASLNVSEPSLIISDVSAKVVLTPGSVSITNFAGLYDNGSVSLVGGLQLGDTGQPDYYHLTVDAKEAHLDDGLIGLLPASLEKVIRQSQLEGRINLHTELNKTFDERADYKVVVDCLGDNISFGWFPYPLRVVTGRLTIRNDSIALEDIIATPVDDVQMVEPAATVKLNGQMTLVNNAFNRGRFRLSASDMLFDEKLNAALTESIGPVFQKLAPAGRFDLNIENVEILNDSNAAKRIDFSGAAEFKSCNFNISGTRAEVDGHLQAKGCHITGSGFSEGQVSLDCESCVIKGKSLTDLKVTIYYDPNQESWSSKLLLADCYGGKVTGELQIMQPARGVLEYTLQAGFDRIDLRRFIQDGKPERAPEKDYTSGTMDALLSLNSRIGEVYSRIGRCRLAIRDMQVGKVSPLAKLLNVLSLTEPTDFAFEQMVVDSYIKRDKLLFEEFDLSGKAVAFYGSGWMDLPSENVTLTLTARGQRLRATEPSVLQSLTEGLGGAVVRMEVTGNVYDPQVQTKTLPVVEDSLRIIGVPR